MSTANMRVDQKAGEAIMGKRIEEVRYGGAAVSMAYLTAKWFWFYDG